jgi:hypothetical protein
MKSSHRWSEPALPDIPARELLVAWGLVAALAVGVAIAPSAPQRRAAAPLLASAARADLALTDPTLGGFETAADRAATLAGLVDAPAGAPADALAGSTVPSPVGSLGPVAQAGPWPALLCQALAAAGARHGG